LVSFESLIYKQFFATNFVLIGQVYEATIILRRSGGGAVIKSTSRVEAGAAAASSRLYSPHLRRRRRLQMKQMQGLLAYSHALKFHLDYN
jgi:hypothetical protein